MVKRRNAARPPGTRGRRDSPRLRVQLRAPGNPDFRQYADLAPRQVASVADLPQAAQVCQAYIAKFELGSGNWGCGAGEVRRNGRLYARISRNGRVWLPDKTTPHPDYPRRTQEEAPGT